MRPALVLLVALLTVPAAAAQLGIANPADGAATLYFHPVGFRDLPVNTQVPEDDVWQAESSVGLATATLTCLPDTPVTGLDQGQHTWYGYSTAGYVEYDRRENGRPMTWPERQLGYNLTLDAGVPPVLFWYVATQSGLGGGDLPIPVPNVVLEATLRVPDDLGVDDVLPASYDTGHVVARGRSAPALLAADASQGVEHSMVDGQHVYGFRLPLDLETPMVGDRGYVVRIDLFVDNPACSDPQAGAFMPDVVRLFGDPAHRPRITAGALEPLRITDLRPSFNGSTVEVVGTLQSVWGNYDVDEGALLLTVEGPATTLALQPSQVVQLTSAHGHHADPVLVTWRWDRSDAGHGLYWLNFTASNDQATAAAHASAAVRLGPDEAYPASVGGSPQAPQRAMPASAAALACLAAAAAAFVARRGR